MIFARRLESGRIAEELGDPDQEVTKQEFEFLWLGAQLGEIVRHATQMQNLHAPLDAPHEGLFFVLGKIVANGLSEQRRYLDQMLRRVLAESVAILVRLRLNKMMLVLDERRGDVLDLHNVIDKARGRGATRHAAFGLTVKVRLGDRQAAMFFDRGQPQRAVAPRAGEDHANGILALILGKRKQECINWAPMFSGRGWFDDDEPAVCYGECGVGRNDKHMVGQDLGAIHGFGHGHGRGLGQDFGEHALVVGGKVLHKHESHAAIGRHIFQEGPERFKAARRRADADNKVG